MLGKGGSGEGGVEGVGQDQIAVANTLTLRGLDETSEPERVWSFS